MKVYVPINDNGIKELETGEEKETRNLVIYEFAPEDYYYLEDHRYFDFLNVECGCLIDLYEEENIPNDKLKTAVDITDILIGQSTEQKFVNLAEKFVEIFELAIKSGTYVNIYCYGDPTLING